MGAITALKPRAEHVFLSPSEVCDLVPGMTVENLKELRAARKGPAFYKPTGERGKVTLYARDEVLAWVERSRIGTREQS